MATTASTLTPTPPAKLEASRDLSFKPFPRLDWRSGHIADSLASLRNYAVDVVQESAAWYQRERWPMKVTGRILRLAAILLTAAAGIIPIVGEITATDGSPGISPLWAAILVAGVATLILIDKFYGFTSAWVRYVQADLELQELLKGFSIDWETSRLSSAQPEPTAEQAAAMVLQCRKLLIQGHGIVRDETQKWVAEFQSVLRQLEEAHKAAVESKALGAISIVVTNGQDCTGGWQLSIDGGSARSCTGRECAVGDIQPGIHVVRVSGKLQRKEVHAERAIEVSAAEIAKVELTLA